jgi:hypothetical protein
MDRAIVGLITLLLFGCTESPDRRDSSSSLASRKVAPWDSAVVHEILRMAEMDQEVRERIISFVQAVQAGAEMDTAVFKGLVASQDSVDEANTARLKMIIAEHGWPSKAHVGMDAAGAAFIIVQHAGHDLAFQKEYLAFLEEEYRKGQASGEAVALLTDRTRQKEGKLQLYGTQMRLEDGGWCWIQSKTRGAWMSGGRRWG